LRLTFDTDPTLKFNGSWIPINLSSLKKILVFELESAIIKGGEDPMAWLVHTLQEIRHPTNLSLLSITLECAKEITFLSYFPQHIAAWDELDKVLSNRDLFPRLDCVRFDFALGFRFESDGYKQVMEDPSIFDGWSPDESAKELTRALIHMRMKSFGNKGYVDVEWSS
jgi:hypothetical protein